MMDIICMKKSLTSGAYRLFCSGLIQRLSSSSAVDYLAIGGRGAITVTVLLDVNDSQDPDDRAEARSYPVVMQFREGSDHRCGD